jgi:membrane associated rhomboid family serine protease
MSDHGTDAELVGAAPGRRPSDTNQFGTPAFYAALGRAFVAMCMFVPVLFLIELLDVATNHALDRAGGIRPRELDGLDGVVFAPFLHANFVHLYSNSLPLLLTGTFVLATGARRFLWVTGLVMLVSGLGAWLTGPAHTVGIGASGVVFGYLGFLLARGIVERSPWSMGVGAVIAVLFGWTLTGVLPGDPRISWQAHLFGLIGGVVAAVLFRRRRSAAPLAEPGHPEFTLGDPTIHLPPE